MDEDPAAIDALLSDLDRIVQDCRASASRVPQANALRMVQAVDAAAAAVERVRRRNSPEAQEQARRALGRARAELTEARRRDAPQD